MKPKPVYLENRPIGHASTTMEVAALASKEGAKIDPYRPSSSPYGISEGPNGFYVERRL